MADRLTGITGFRSDGSPIYGSVPKYAYIEDEPLFEVAGFELEGEPVGVGVGAGATPLNGVATLDRSWVAPPTLPAGTELDGVATNGVAEIGGEAVYATPVALPLAGAITAVMSLGFFKALLVKFGPMLLKIMVGAAAFTAFMKLLGLGAPDSTELPIQPRTKRRKRYSIGANPRVGTLSKVSRHCMRMLKRHRKVIDEFLPPKRHGLPARALAGTYLSTAEKKLLR